MRPHVWHGDRCSECGIAKADLPAAEHVHRTSALHCETRPDVTGCEPELFADILWKAFLLGAEVERAPRQQQIDYRGNQLAQMYTRAYRPLHAKALRQAFLAGRAHRRGR